MRKYRKREHIENYLRSTFKGNPLFEDVFVYHNALPCCDFKKIDTSMEFLSKRISFPLMINAMTGGTDFTEDINENLANLAKTLNLPMAVGSETIALEDEDAAKSFKIVRDVIGDEGVVIANISSYASVEDAKFAIELIKADGLQVHLNPAQELAMDEGERDFTNILENIKNIIEAVEVPVIVKEVGFGISRDVADKLYSVGAKYIDVAGFGGSNFFEVENLRTPYTDVSELYGWGIPTAMALIENVKNKPEDLFIISSGGVKNSLDVIKSLVLGADLVGMSGEILSYLVHGGYEYTLKYLTELIEKTRISMALTGSKNVSDLRNVEYRLTGKLKELVKE